MTHARTTTAPIARGSAARSSSSIVAALLLAFAALAPLAAQDAVPAAEPTPAAASETAAATKKSGAQIAEGLENWKAGIDLSSYPPGKYNLVVEGRDKAGNLTEYPPVNLYVDPASDLPRVTVVNPTPLLRVGGDLNIVGTCVDDDGVGRVEVSLDGGEYKAAEGTDFWSLYLETADISDGRRTIDVRGVDVNGLVGKSVRIAFDLDRSEPLAEVTSHAPGSLVSGQIRLEGSVFDLNGVRSLGISLDGGESYANVELRKGKDATRLEYSFPVDTRKLPDGPQVFWLKSVDGVGSRAKAAFLLFVDNTKPVIEIARPATGQSVNGRFSVAGAVRDVVGVKSLGYVFAGTEQGEIALTKGDPYFVKEFDSSSVKGDKVDLVLVAEDSIGNVTRISIAPKIDRAADLPVLTVVSPAAGGVLRPGDPVCGSVRDDDGVSTVRWSLDGGAPAETACSESFAIALPEGLASGKHLVSLTPVDSNGLAGAKVDLAFSLDRGPGAVRFERLAGLKSERAFAPGIETAVDSGESLFGSVEAPNPLASLSYALGDSDPKPLPVKAEGGVYRFAIPIDRSFPYGFVTLSVKASDAAGNSYEGRTLVYVANYGAIREDSGFRFVDPRVADADPASPIRVDLGSGGDLVGAFYREELESLRFEPATDLVEASFEDIAVRIAARKEGISAPTRLVGRTKRGHEFSAGPFVFVADSAGPKLSLDGAAEGTWFNGILKIGGSATDPGGLAGIAYRILPDGSRSAGESVAISPRADGSFSFSLSAAELPPGPFSLEIEAKDASGNASRAVLSLGADVEPPELRFIAPESGAEIWGIEDVLAFVEDASGVASVEYAEDGTSFAPIERNSGFFVHRADFAAHPQAAYRVIDLAGNAATARPEVAAVPAPSRTPSSDAVSAEPRAGAEARVELAGTSGIRKVSLLLPGLGDADFAALGFAAGDPPPERFATRLLVSGALALKGQASLGEGAPAPLKAVSVSYDGGATYAPLAAYKDQKSAKTALPFALSLAAAGLKPGEARWIIKVEDFAGTAYFCPVYALVDLAPPSLSILYPQAGAASFPGPFPLLAKAQDDNGLSSAELASGTVKESVDVSSGGRYFVRVVDPSQIQKGGAGAATISVRDAAGNAASAQQKYAYDAAGDLPAIAVADIPATLRSGDLVSGGVKDDDGPCKLAVSVDGGEPVAFALGSFAFQLPALASGKHQLLVSAADPGGRKSEARRELAVTSGPPSLSGIELGDAKSRAPWTPGAAFALGPGSMVSGNVSAPNGFSSAELSVDGGAPIKATLGKAAAPGEGVPFTAALPAGLAYGRVVLALRAVDAVGLSAETRCELHLVLPSALEADDAEALRISDERIETTEGGLSAVLAPGDKLVGRFNGRPIQGVSLKPATELLAASFDGASVSLEAKAEGLSGPTELVVRTVDGDEFAWGPLSARVDASPPELELASPSDHEWDKSQVRVSGRASDPNGLVALEVSVNGGEGQSLLPAAEAAKGAAAGVAQREYVFDRALDLAAATDGTVRLDFLARDGAGRESSAVRFINKDTLPPELVQVLPAPGESVNGTMTVVVEAKDSGRLASAAFLAAAAQAPEEVAGLGLASRTLDFARLAMPLPAGGGFAVADKAGNQSILPLDLVVDKEKDKPVSEIHTPPEMEVLRGDFSISGVAYDDDGLAAAYCRIDSGEWQRLAMDGTSYSVPVALKDTTDNEHLVEVKAEDIYGVQGDVVSRRYRISKAEPVARMTQPPLAKPSRGTIELAGTSSDANGIGEIAVSLDSRVSYNRPKGTESWSYFLDTRVIADGLHPVAVRPIDAYGTEGFYASLIYVDNTPPKAAIDLPADGEICHRTMLVSGRVSDNLALASSRIEIAPVGQALPPALVIDLGTEGIVRRIVDVSALKPGTYTVRIVARDRADNETLASRDVAIAGGAPADRVDILYPLEGSALGGRLVVYGRAQVARSGAPAPVSIRSGDAELGVAQPDSLGYFAFEIPAAGLADGAFSFTASTVTEDGRAVSSRATSVEWKRLGPWVSIDSFPAGRYLPYRPFLEGRAGWTADAPDPADKAAVDAYRKAEKERVPVLVELSLDNGRSFRPADGVAKWKFRLETQDYPEGGLYIIVRARYKDGSAAWAKTLLFLDKTPPELQLAAPVENGRYNGVLAVSGIASDANGLEAISVAVRKGDKKSYAVPGFIQGLYLDGHALGATTWDAGLGLTFFDDNVKLQANYGQAPETDASGTEQRFFGTVFGAKIIANVGLLPFNALFGPDWAFLSASLGVGANFSYFTQTQSGESLIVSAVIAQFEFPKVTMKEWRAFRTFSFYTELQVWVVSSDVEGGFIPRMSFGTRVGVF